MGNDHSTRWRNHVKATTVESCAQLDIAVLEHHDLLRDPLTGGTIELGHTVELAFVIGPTTKDVRLLGIRWDVTDLLGNVRTNEQWIMIEFMNPVRGKAAWRFSCPGWRTDESCGRSVEKLYLPQEGRRFACRLCWGLVYRSSQTSGTFASRYRQMARAADEAGVKLSDAGLDLEPADGGRLLRTLLEDR